jgi:uncharacterized protein YjbI with pentapeptide repeats
MGSFLKGVDFLWLVGILSGMIGGIWAFYRFVYEKKLERFKQATTNIFSDNEDEVLAAVANLGVFKRDFLFERNTIDVLLTRLYKELNYNITNAITNALIQFSNRRELLYIASEILSINRNFFFQTSPYQLMLNDVKKQYTRIKNIRDNQLQEVDDFVDIESEKELMEKRLSLYNSDFLKMNEKVAYELKWHKQITGDTYARIIRRAGALRMTKSIIFLNYIKQILFNWDFHFYNRKINVDLYQNPFSNVHLVQFKTNRCSMRRCGFEYALLADIDFNDIKEIYDCLFQKTLVTDCNFNKGLINESVFIDVEFRNISFNRIEFRDIYFANCNLTKTAFSNCTGLTAKNFYGTILDEKTVLPEGINRKAIEKLKFLEVYQDVQNSNLRVYDKNLISQVHAENIKNINEIVQIYKSDLSQAVTEDFIMRAGKNFTFYGSYHSLLRLDLSIDKENYLLRLLFSNKKFEDFAYEVFLSGLTEEDMLRLPYIKPGYNYYHFQDALRNIQASTESLNQFFDALAAVYLPAQKKEDASAAEKPASPEHKALPEDQLLQ